MTNNLSVLPNNNQELTPVKPARRFHITGQLNKGDLKAIKPSGSIQKLHDGGGLLLWVTPAGTKYWKFKYKYSGKERCINLGTYIGPKHGMQLVDARKL